MKVSVLSFAICTLVTLDLGLVTKADAETNSCEDSPRFVGAFGAMDKPKPPVAIAIDIRSQLPEVGAVRRVHETKLSPSGEAIIMYDTKADAEPNPKVAVVVQGKVAKVFDLASLVEYGEGGVYASSCEFELAPSQKALAIAYTLSGDGTGSAFLVLTWFGGNYQVIFHRTVGQGRMVLGSRTLELWERAIDKHAAGPESPNFECEWCQHRYLITEFEWRSGGYIKTRSKRTSRAYDPAEISGSPLLIRAAK
jgi:hypothetical protein